MLSATSILGSIVPTTRMLISCSCWWTAKGSCSTILDRHISAAEHCTLSSPTPTLVAPTALRLLTSGCRTTLCCAGTSLQLVTCHPSSPSPPVHGVVSTWIYSSRRFQLLDCDSRIRGQLTSTQWRRSTTTNSSTSSTTSCLLVYLHDSSALVRQGVPRCHAYHPTART